ncbi:Na+/H+ antiporter NhaA [uncultured Ruegeria sp.]|nr:Na+/H+ antiporter NhaA [uncultured Ruegeria sp.]
MWCFRKCRNTTHSEKHCVGRQTPHTSNRCPCQFYSPCISSGDGYWLRAVPAGDRQQGDTATRHNLRQASRAVTEALSPVERLETMLHPWVGFAIMPIFALANAGITVQGADFEQPVSLAIIVGLVLGKPIGVFGFSWLAVRSGLAVLAPGLSGPLILAGSFLTGIGFTMSLFIAGLAFDPATLNAAKLGILSGSAIAATAGILMLLLLTIHAARTKSATSTAEQDRVP